MANPYHEENLPEAARDVHRALNSLQEELEAVDWYNQRAAASTDDGLKAILLHNRNEEIEHAAMLLEHLRRVMPEFDHELRTYLFSDRPVTEVEEAGAEQAGETRGGGGSLGIGRLG